MDLMGLYNSILSLNTHSICKKGRVYKITLSDFELSFNFNDLKEKSQKIEFHFCNKEVSNYINIIGIYVFLFGVYFRDGRNLVESIGTLFATHPTSRLS